MDWTHPHTRKQRSGHDGDARGGRSTSGGDGTTRTATDTYGKLRDVRGARRLTLRVLVATSNDPRDEEETAVDDEDEDPRRGSTALDRMEGPRPILQEGEG